MIVSTSNEGRPGLHVARKNRELIKIAQTRPGLVLTMLVTLEEAVALADLLIDLVEESA